jgi:hypothetical protein
MFGFLPIKRRIKYFYQDMILRNCGTTRLVVLARSSSEDPHFQVREFCGSIEPHMEANVTLRYHKRMNEILFFYHETEENGNLLKDGAVCRLKRIML